MKLAQMIKENPPTNNSFVEEYIDAHNNIGMLEFDLDNWEEARKVLTKGLEICDEEEVMEDDAGRSRLHHNLGNVYLKLRMWDNAREHIEKDIIISKRIEHCQGEAKGYINLGELHYLIQKKVMDELKKEEQNLKKLTRDMAIARGTPRERKCLLQQIASLDCLIENQGLYLPSQSEVTQAVLLVNFRSCDPVDIEQSSSSCKSRNLNVVTQKPKGVRALRSDESPIVASVSKGDTSVSKSVVYDNDAAHRMFLYDDEHNVSATQFTCMQMVHSGSIQSNLPVTDTGWVQKRLIKLYTDCCYKSSVTPNMKLLKKLYEQEVSDDDVNVSDCGLQDFSLMPLLDALHADKTFAMVDLSHNELGLLYAVTIISVRNHTFKFAVSRTMICKCPSLFARLEVLNISENPLTDTCASCLSTILENCKALCSLSIERCSVTSRTIQKVAEALNAILCLSNFVCIGFNYPIHGNTIINVLSKLGTSKRFSKLSLNGLRLKQSVVDSLCKLAKTLSLSGLSLRETGIGIDEALLLTESLFSQNSEFVKLDISKCKVTSNYIHRLSTDSSMICGIVELNLSENPITEKEGLVFLLLAATTSSLSTSTTSSLRSRRKFILPNFSPLKPKNV
ncbi:hypothetical protein C1H46_018328 [Malus baccata]|uniref:Uncharacterized protein n=1 Tax=Malus baccata TaxID=106549 RepID=A0A540MC05_MALBA|nr:hypothetical protein C1H46_018328 [Malus baccata]